MKFLTIDATNRTVQVSNHADLYAAMEAVGLKQGETDFGSVGAQEPAGGGYSIVLYEFGLFSEPATTHYFELGGNLYAGNAVIFRYDRSGETADFPEGTTVIPRFMTGDEAILAVHDGNVRRPETSIDGDVIWQWPNPPPDDMPDRARQGR